MTQAMWPNLQTCLPTQLANHPVEAGCGKPKNLSLIGTVHSQKQRTRLLAAGADPGLDCLPGLRRQSQRTLFCPSFPKDGQGASLPIDIWQVQGYDFVP